VENFMDLSAGFDSFLEVFHFSPLLDRESSGLVPRGTFPIMTASSRVFHVEQAHSPIYNSTNHYFSKFSINSHTRASRLSHRLQESMPANGPPLPNPFLDDAALASDEQLVSCAKSNNHDQLELLLSRHFPWLFNLSTRMLYRRTDTEDATPEIPLKSITGLPSSEGRQNSELGSIALPSTIC
jgi:hypothetical protein